jgi:hypothetical protein
MQPAYRKSANEAAYCIFDGRSCVEKRVGEKRRKLVLCNRFAAISPGSFCLMVLYLCVCTQVCALESVDGFITGCVNNNWSPDEEGRG